jgi:hypothetical protein
MAQGESSLSRRIASEARNRGAFIFKIHGGPTMMAGLPDLILCYRGLFVSLETKMPEGRGASPAQRLRMRQIRRAGGISYVVRSVKAAMYILDRIDWKLDSEDN